MLEKQLMDIKKLDPPFKQAPKPRPKERITWLEPELVAEIKFAQWTKDGLLRQASFKGLRTDKDPKDIRKEVPEDETPLPSPSVRTERSGESKMKDVTIGGIRITNPDRVVYEDTKITKEDVAKYYLKVSQRILPFVANRILSVLRCPKGISQTCFYRKHPHPGNKGVKTLPYYWQWRDRGLLLYRGYIRADIRGTDGNPGVSYLGKSYPGVRKTGYHGI